MTASHERTSTTLRAWSIPVTTGMVTHRFASRRSKPGSTPTTAPPARAAPREAASITPVRPPQNTTPPARAMAAPTRSAVRAVAREHAPSPTTPMCRAMRARDGIIAASRSHLMPQPSLKIDRARYVLTVDDRRRIIRDGSILIERGRIARVGRGDELADARADRVIDARNFVVTPGFVNGHMHISYAHPVRGIFPDDLGSPLKHVFALQMAMTEEEEYHTSLLAILELVSNGTVCLLDPGSTKNPTEYLEALGVLGPNVLLAHALGLDDGEVDCVARTGAAVTMCPVTAAKGARGAAAHGRMPELLARGVRVALGCDSPNNSNHLDLVRVMNMAAIQYKDARQDITQISAETALEMGTRLGAAAVGLGDELGAIEAGKRAELVL